MIYKPVTKPKEMQTFAEYGINEEVIVSRVIKAKVKGAAFQANGADRSKSSIQPETTSKTTTIVPSSI